MTTKRSGLHKQLTRTFLLQGLLIAFATACGIFLTNWLLANVLVEEALQQEADHYWALVSADPDVAMANSKNLRGYLLPRDNAIAEEPIKNLAPGYHTLDIASDYNAFFVSSQNGQRLILAFNRAQVDSLISLYGLIPLILILALMYPAIYITYRLIHRTVSPTVLLAKKVRQLDPINPDTTTFQPESFNGRIDSDVATLAEALLEYTERIGGFIERERAFTRDASHELRTPITVIRTASQLLSNDTQLSPYHHSLANKINRASEDMGELVEAFLALAREQDFSQQSEMINLNPLARKEFDKLKETADEKGIEFYFSEENSILIQGNPSILSILLNNLLSNALKYTDHGKITMSLKGQNLVIEDTGIGIPEDKLNTIFEPYVRSTNTASGYGVGLSIVKRLCDQFGWLITFTSQDGSGTQVRVTFG